MGANLARHDVPPRSNVFSLFSFVRKIAILAIHCYSKGRTEGTGMDQMMVGDWE
jgi:hypothetical protein